MWVDLRNIPLELLSTPMSEMRVPITDAFDESDRLESLEVELTRKQVEWLREKADERNLSLDHVLRSVITAQIRGQDESMEPSSPVSGDGQPPVSPSAAPDDTDREMSIPSDAAADDEEDDDSPSIVDSLRSASERLQDLTEQDDEAETPDPHDTLKRLQARLGEGPEADDESEEESPGTVILQNQNRSMFDMMEDE